MSSQTNFIDINVLQLFLCIILEIKDCRIDYFVRPLFVYCVTVRLIYIKIRFYSTCSWESSNECYGVSSYENFTMYPYHRLFACSLIVDRVAQYGSIQDVVKKSLKKKKMKTKKERNRMILNPKRVLHF